MICLCSLYEKFDKQEEERISFAQTLGWYWTGEVWTFRGRGSWTRIPPDFIEIARQDRRHGRIE